MGGVRVGERQQPQSAWSRAAGSSWNKSNSGWNVGAKDPRPLLRRKAVTDFEGTNFDEDYDGGEENSTSNRDSDTYSKTGGATEEPKVELNVQKEEGVFRVKGSVETVVDPDTLYGIITDYNSNARIFRNVDRVAVVQKGDDTIVTQFLHWNFLRLSGNYDIQMRMKDNSENRSISYELERPGFLKVFNGSWTVEPVSSGGDLKTSKLVVDQRALPSFFPTTPLAVGAGAYAQKIMSTQVSNLLSDLASEASQIKKNEKKASVPASADSVDEPVQKIL